MIESINKKFHSGRPRFVPQSAVATSNAKISSTNSRPGHTVSQSQPGSRSTSPNSLKSSHYLSSVLRTPTNTRSRIPIGSSGGSRISSRESSPGRTRMLNIKIFFKSVKKRKILR
jgi:hypothetical protein